MDGRPDLARRRPESGKSSSSPASPTLQSATALQARRNGIARCAVPSRLSLRPVRHFRRGEGLKVPVGQTSLFCEEVVQGAYTGEKLPES